MDIENRPVYLYGFAVFLTVERQKIRFTVIISNFTVKKIDPGKKWFLLKF
jgi:hypothetical protein